MDVAADIKIFAANRLAGCGDPVQAASETEAHFAKQHRFCSVHPRQVQKWLADGVGEPGWFTTNSRGGGWKTGSELCTPEVRGHRSPVH